MGGHPGDPGAAASSEAASRVASDAAATPESADDESLEFADAASPAEERELEAAVESEEEFDAAVEDEPVIDGVPVAPDDLEAKAAKADEYLALAQRTQADFENYRKRATREAAAAQARGVVKLAKELLPAIDDLDRALAAAQAAGDGADDTLVSGIKLVHADVIAALARVGIEPYSPQGERFDPQHHEAVAQQPVEGIESGTVVEVYQRGYALGDSVIRPARVVVAG
jgi:molecular chaperone GrpE